MAQGGYRPGAGRPRGKRSIYNERVQEYIAEQIHKNVKPIVDAAISGAKKGNKDDRQWLFDRGFGKAAQVVFTEDENGDKKPITGVTITVES